MIVFLFVLLYSTIHWTGIDEKNDKTIGQKLMVDFIS